MSAAAKASPADTSRAYRTRAKKSRGQATPAELAWLDRYERDHPPVRPARGPAAAAANDNAPGDAPPSSPPPADAPPPGASAGPPPIDVPEGKAPPTDAELAQDAERAAKLKAEAAELAGTLCTWLAAASHEVRELGGLALPDWAIGKVVFPALAAVIERTAPLQAIQDERAQVGVCVVAFGGTFAQRHVLRKRLAERGGARVIDADSSPPPPTEAPPAASGATGGPVGWRS